MDGQLCIYDTFRLYQGGHMAAIPEHSIFTGRTHCIGCWHSYFVGYGNGETAASLLNGRPISGSATYVNICNKAHNLYYIQSEPNADFTPQCRICGIQSASAALQCLFSVFICAFK